jgi:hypothetical protein
MAFLFTLLEIRVYQGVFTNTYLEPISGKLKMFPFSRVLKKTPLMVFHTYEQLLRGFKKSLGVLNNTCFVKNP